MATRKTALALLRVALLENDIDTALRVYLENRISAKTFYEYRKLYWRKPGRQQTERVDDATKASAR